jgi:hypothetical protein
LGCTQWKNGEIYANPDPKIVVAITATAKKCHNVGYNKAELAFIEAESNNIKITSIWR